MKKLILSLLLVLVPTLTPAAILFDAVSELGGSASVGNILHTVTAVNPDPILVVAVSWRGVTGGRTLDSVTYNTVALTEGPGITQGDVRTELWYLIGPATGSNNTQVTFSSAARFQMQVASYTGSTAVGATGTNSVAAGSSLSQSVSTTQTNSFLVAVTAYNSALGTITQGSGITERDENDSAGGGGGVRAALSDRAATTIQSYLMDYTFSATRDAVLAILEIKEPVATGAALPFQTIFLD